MDDCRCETGRKGPFLRTKGLHDKARKGPSWHPRKEGGPSGERLGTPAAPRTAPGCRLGFQKRARHRGGEMCTSTCPPACVLSSIQHPAYVIAGHTTVLVVLAEREAFIH